MASFTIGQLIKIILVVFVVSLVIYFVAMFFKNNVLDFFRNLPGANSSNVILGLLK